LPELVADDDHVRQVGSREDQRSGEAIDGKVARRAEGDAHRCGDEQHWLVYERAERMAQVAREIFDHADTARVAGFLADAFHAAERADGHSARFGGRHAASDVLLDLLFEVQMQLPLELRIHAVVPEQGTRPELENVDPAARHRSTSYALRSVRRMAAERRSHCVSSFCSCARPALVRE
jgi:hypothetical protein